MSPARADETQLPPAELLDELLTQRRFIRFYSKDRIDRCLLSETVGCGAYARTSNHDLEGMSADDREVMASLGRTLALRRLTDR